MFWPVDDNGHDIGGGISLRIGAPNWVDARAWAMRMFGTEQVRDYTSPRELPLDIELRWIGSDYVRPERRLQYREWLDFAGTKDWTEWRNANG